MQTLQKRFEMMLEQRLAFGESRHQAKSEGTASAKIFSHNTMHTYKRMVGDFAHYCEERGVKRPANAKALANDYIQSLKDKGASPWTQQSVRSAIHKLYGEAFITTQCDAKRRECITRSRLDTAQARHFSEKNNAELISFCKHTGLRRSELERLDSTTNKVVERHGQAFITNIKGKGGKVRDVPILNNDQAVIDKINNADGIVWGRVHSNANIHGYRGDYAQALYDSLARDVQSLPKSEVYHCQGDKRGDWYDKQAMREVSNALGHNRIDVIANNYLYK